MNTFFRTKSCTALTGFLLLLFVMLPQFVSAQDVNISVAFYPNNVASGTPVTLTLQGKLYSGNSWFDELAKDPGGLTEDEKVIMAVVDANRSGTSVDILKLWSPDERESIASMMSDSQLFAKNQGYYKRVTGSAFIGRVLYGDYIICLVQHDLPQSGSIIKEYPIHKVDGKYYMTNKLANDPVFMYLTQKYRQTLSLKTH